MLNPLPNCVAGFASGKGQPRALAGELGWPGHLPLLEMEQVHGAAVARVSAQDPSPYPAVDGLVAGPGVALALRTADCVPVMVRTREQLGVAHAGWRGCAAGILGALLDCMDEQSPQRLQVLLGPAICGDCYEVGDEVLDALAPLPAGALAQRTDGTRTLDLRQWLRGRLLERGLPPSTIHIHPDCTHHSGAWPSWRREPTDQRLFGVLGALP